MLEQLDQGEDAIRHGLKHDERKDFYLNLRRYLQLDEYWQEPCPTVEKIIFEGQPELSPVILQKLYPNLQWSAPQENLWSSGLQVESVPLP